MSENDISFIKSISHVFPAQAFLGDREEWSSTILDSAWHTINTDIYLLILCTI